MSDTTETETDTNTNTDEPTKAELHDRVRELESTVEKLMPSRRDALRMGAAGIAGAAGLSAASQSADAATGSAGTIGSSSDRPDLLADEVDTNTATLNGKTLNGHSRIFSKSFAGGTLSESISLADDKRSQYIIFDGISPGGLTQITATFGNVTSSSYFYNLEDRGGTGTTTTGDTKIKLCNNLGTGGFGGRYQIVETRDTRISLVGTGVVSNASEQKLTSAGFRGSVSRGSIQLNSDGSLTAGKIELWEEIV